MGETADHLKEGAELFTQGKAREGLDRYGENAVMEFEGSIIGGTCLYRDVCGGSRARAYASTLDPLGSDPTCLRVQTGLSAVVA